MISRFGSAFLVACLALAAGCGKGRQEITTLSGRVTLNGKPVTAGTVNVVSDDDVIRTSGTIAADGTYSIAGAPVGPVKVSVSTEDYREIMQETGPGAARVKRNPLYVATPKRYERFETAGLATKVPRGKATYDVELSSK